VALQPISDLDCLTRFLDRAHARTRARARGRTNGTSDQLVAEATTYIINTKDQHARCQRDSNSRSQDSSGFRPHGPWDQLDKSQQLSDINRAYSRSNKKSWIWAVQFGHETESNGWSSGPFEICITVKPEGAWMWSLTRIWYHAGERTNSHTVLAETSPVK